MLFSVSQKGIIHMANKLLSHCSTSFSLRSYFLILFIQTLFSSRLAPLIFGSPSISKAYFKYSKHREYFQQYFYLFPFTFQADGKILKNSLLSLLACLKLRRRPLHSQLPHRTATAFEWICLDYCQNTLFYKIYLKHFQALDISFIQL